MKKELRVNNTHNLTDVFGDMDETLDDEFDDEDNLLRLQHLEMLSFIENKFQCAGMCQPGLFYFSRNITEGIPEETCLTLIHEEIVNETGSLSIMSTLLGLVALWCFCVHFFMYGKLPNEEEKHSE